MYAVLEAGGKQYTVKPGDELDVERLQAEPGKTFTFERVLFVSSEGQMKVGVPVVANAAVVADVVRHLRGPKVITFKMKRRKGYHKTIGHRQELTRVRISEIKL